MTSADHVALPSGTAPELLRLVDQLWGSDAITVVSGSAAPAGLRVVDQFVVTPSFRSARMLLPARSARARYGALAQYNGLRQGLRRYARSALAAGARTGLDRLVTKDVVSICVPAALSAADVSELSVTAWLEQRLGHNALHSAIGVGNPSPNRKPTIQMFTSQGQPMAFVKVGWNDLTTEMVTNEARALERLEAGGLSAPRRPRVLFFERWQGLTMLGIEPMPLDVRGHSATDCPPTGLGAMNQESGAGGAEAYHATLGHRLDELLALDQLSDAEAATLRAGSIPAAAAKEFAAAPWHGDWVAWNMADRGDELWVWDWEHFADCAPVGFDLLNFHFQQRFTPAGQSVADSIAFASQELGAQRGGQLAPTIVAATARAFIVELYVRAAHMNALGAGWDERFHEPAIRWLEGQSA